MLRGDDLTMRLVGTILVAVALVACTGDGSPTTDGTTPAERPSSPATLEILRPEAGEVVDGPTVEVAVELTGATLIEEVTTDISPDEGHVHLSLDGETISLLAGLEETIKRVEPGTHLLEVEFVAGDHGPFEPRVLQSVTFEVR
jgi:hypothetical protein